jgi:hypothetical protein
MGLPVRIIAGFMLFLSSWSLVACGDITNPSSSATAPPTATTTAAAPAPLTATTTSPLPPSGGPAPEQLIGTWTRVVSTADEAAAVTFSTNGFRVRDKLGGGNGDIVVNGNEIDFFNVPQCGLVLPEGVGRYQWTLRSATLHFAPLNNDPCPVRHDHFADQDFTRNAS